jgi:IMP dehydrogenase
MFNDTLSFDDVLLVPQKSDIESRKEIDIGSELDGHKFALPVISSPMDTVTEGAMLTAMHEAGGFGIVHRYNSIEEQVEVIQNAAESGITALSAAIGVTGDFRDRAEALVATGARILCIDVAHGHHTNVERALKTLKDKFGDDVKLIAGNVATDEGYVDLCRWGADAVRVGIGGGSICSTRIQTGHGLSTFQTVIACNMARTAAVSPFHASSRYDFDPKPIIADGGIKTSGDIVKAMAVGADFVILGSMLAGTAEAPGSVFTNSSGKSFKAYRGMASREAQEAWKGSANSLEGVSTTIPYKGPVGLVLEDIAQNVRSGFSYSGARSKEELREKSQFVLQTSGSQVESGVHILNVR